VDVFFDTRKTLDYLRKRMSKVGILLHSVLMLILWKTASG